jgi:hypothetical protein
VFLIDILSHRTSDMTIITSKLTENQRMLKGSDQFPVEPCGQPQFC